MLFWRQYYWLLSTCGEWVLRVPEKSETQTNANKIIKSDVAASIYNVGLSLDCAAITTEDDSDRTTSFMCIICAYIYIYSRLRLTDPIPTGLRLQRARVWGWFLHQNPCPRQVRSKRVDSRPADKTFPIRIIVNSVPG